MIVYINSIDSKLNTVSKVISNVKIPLTSEKEESYSISGKKNCKDPCSICSKFVRHVSIYSNQSMARYFFLFTPFVCSVIISYKISLSISSNPFVYFLSSLSYTGFSTRHRASARSSSSSHWRLETASNFWRTEGRHHHHMIIVIIVSHHRCHFYRHRRSSVSSSSSSRLRRPETETLKDDGTRGKKFRHGCMEE